MSNGTLISRRRLIGLGALAGSVVALAACAAPASSPAPSPAAPPPSGSAPTPAPATAKVTPASEGTRQLATDLSLGFTSINTTMDPHGTLSNSGFMMARQMFDALVTWDDPGEKIIPQLAHEWTRIDNTTMEFKLRDDVKFSNGEDFTAEAVKFSIERVINSTEPLLSSTKSRMEGIVGAEVVNSTTVRVKTSGPDPLLLNKLTMLFMVPPKYTAEGGDLNTKPVGTGSFRAVEYVTGERMRFEAWDGSWRGKSTIQTVTFQQVPEAATLIAALKSGQVDIIFQPPADQLQGLQNEGFKTISVNSGSCTICSLLPNHPLTRDKRVREAINLAVNKEEILQVVQAGFGQISRAQLLQPGLLGYRPDFQPYPYDPERARALLREANVGNQEFNIMTSASTRPFVDAIVGYLTAVGLNARTEPVELPLIVQALNVNSDRPSVAWNTDYFQIRDFDAAGGRFTKDWTFPHFENDEMTDLFRAQKTELDQQRRGEMIGRMAEIMRDEFAVLFLFHRDYPSAMSPKIVKLEQPYDTSYRLWTVEKER